MKTIIKFIFSGGMAALINLLILYFLNNLGLYYLLSINISFIIAVLVSFGLQKYWAFTDAKDEKSHQQLAVFFLFHW